MSGKKGKKSSRKKNRGLMRRMFVDTGVYRKYLTFSIILVITGRLCLAVAPRVAGRITDILQKEVLSQNYSVGNFLPLAIALAVLYFYGNLSDGFVNKNMVLVGEQLALKLRNAIQKKLNHLPLNYMDSHPSGDILSRATNDVVTFTNDLESTLPTLLGQSVMLVTATIMMLITNPILTLIYVVVVPIGFFIASRISAGTRKRYREQQRVLGELGGTVTDVYANHLLTKAYGCEDERQKHFDECSARYAKAYTMSRFLSGFIIPTSVLTTSISYICLCIVGGVMMMRGSLSLGGFQTFLLYGNMVGTPLSSIATAINNTQEGLAAVALVYEFLDEEEEPVETPSVTLDGEAVKGSVVFDHVRFGYVPDKILMHDVSLEAKPGMTMAVVGPSGAGKTTLVNLLLRFYDIQGGRILVDGQDTKNISRENLRSAFGMVLQDSWIFSGTIADNIAYGKPGATREEVIAAARKVQCDTFIDKLPRGYDTMISEENSALSSGEKQLLVIARTVLADPAVLILDEATSQVDTRTETLITAAMEKMMTGRTCFVIAHRLFTIQGADQIIFMAEGDIKEVGSHDELMARGGMYAQMYASLA